MEGFDPSIIQSATYLASQLMASNGIPFAPSYPGHLVELPSSSCCSQGSLVTGIWTFVPNSIMPIASQIFPTPEMSISPEGIIEPSDGSTSSPFPSSDTGVNSGMSSSPESSHDLSTTSPPESGISFGEVSPPGSEIFFEQAPSSEFVYPTMYTPVPYYNYIPTYVQSMNVPYSGFLPVNFDPHQAPTIPDTSGVTMETGQETLAYGFDPSPFDWAIPSTMTQTVEPTRNRRRNRKSGHRRMQQKSAGVKLNENRQGDSSIQRKSGTGKEQSCCKAPPLECVTEGIQNGAYDYVDNHGPYYKTRPLTQRGSKVKRGPKKQVSVCRFCLSNKETPQFYKSHLLFDESGKVTCPILYKLICPICGKTGEEAHTFRYCPRNRDHPGLSPEFSVYEGYQFSRNSAGDRMLLKF